MNLFSKLYLLVSEVHPGIYGVIYFLIIPAWGLLYIFAAPHGFYAPYAYLEPSSQNDAARVALMLEKVIGRSIAAQTVPQVATTDWELNWQSVKVDRVGITDPEHVHFVVRLNADGLNKYKGNKQVGWSALVNVTEKPVAERLGKPGQDLVYRLPEIDTTKYPSPFASSDPGISHLLFEPQKVTFDSTAPTLSLLLDEDLAFMNYISGAKGDPDGFNDRLWRMIYLSAVVITTLGLGDIVPITPAARWLVGAEAVLGVMLVGLFLSALSHRASAKQN